MGLNIEKDGQFDVQGMPNEGERKTKINVKEMPNKYKRNAKVMPGNAGQGMLTSCQGMLR